MLLSIVIPVYNEEHLVCELLQKVIDLKLIAGLEKEILVIDDGSTDRTYEHLERFIYKQGLPNLRLLAHEKNQGKGAAIRTGFSHACGDIVIVQDADLEYDPEDINAVVQPILNGASIVYGSRILREKALNRSGFLGLVTGKHPHSYVLAYLGGVMITQWTNLLSGAKLTDEPTCYKCFTRQVLEGIHIESDDFSWEPEITMKLLKLGHPIDEVPISYHPRKNHEGKKINWKHGVMALWTIWKFR
jgi:dolichol-phosphate mannosyltransferase